MKTRFYILLVLVLSFSFTEAQNTTEVSVETIKTVSVSQDNNDEVVVNDTLNTTKEGVLLISEDELRESIARTASDIRTYFNKMRNVDNIKLLFPKMNKAKKA
ncbi:hypothetical protein BWZ22_12305 [Seonamhaeicola sp. S2-3]|uniref:hypothetical protein n=1 Tax=Seonamhaeicola sp. S2-3 TaxID=1936081 RepID=UPI00097271DC|nr:hypothetical protein [Seonamhaeicola sp. S2-3]APY11962.1 hypothetical protein BWZ22_12305 [Seonamhaeicola sp. S2-3]